MDVVNNSNMFYTRIISIHINNAFTSSFFYEKIFNLQYVCVCVSVNTKKFNPKTKCVSILSSWPSIYNNIIEHYDKAVLYNINNLLTLTYQGKLKQEPPFPKIRVRACEVGGAHGIL